MTIQITDRQGLAVRTHAKAVLDVLGVKDAADYVPHRQQWGDLTSHAKEAIKCARSLIDKIDGVSDAEMKTIEEAHEALLEIHAGCEAEKDERSQTGNRSPRLHGGDHRRPLGEAIDNRGGRRVGEPYEIETVGLRPEQRMADRIREQGAEDYEITPGQYLRAMVIGAKNDAERRALSEGTDSAGGFTVPDILSSQFIDLMRARTRVVQAGARTVPLTSDFNSIAKVATDPAPAWRDEAAAVAEADPTFARVTFVPQSLAVLIKASREVLEDSLNIETILPHIVTQAMAVELDRVALLGTGTSPEPEGIANFTGVQTIAHDAALTNYAPLISAQTKVLTVNAPEVTAFILHPRDTGTLGGLTATDNQPLMVPPVISSVPMRTTTSIPVDGGVGSDESTIFAGDFTKLMIGMRHEVSITVLRERYMDSGQFAFVAFLRADIAAEHESAFCTITGVMG